MIATRMFYAFFYDALILIALLFTQTAVCLVYRQGNPISSGTLWYQLCLLLLIYGYYWGSYRFGGQTIGMRAWRLKITAHSQPLTHIHILKRFLLIPIAHTWALMHLQNPQKFLSAWTKTAILDLRKDVPALI